MFSRRYYIWNLHEMKQTPIILVSLFIASAYISNNLVVANEQQQDEQLEIIKKYAVIGNNLTLSCETPTTTSFKWNKNGVNITEENTRFHLRYDNNDQSNNKYLLIIEKVEANDTGNYTCEQFGPIDGDVVPVKKQFSIFAVILPKILDKSPARIETRIGQSVLLYCLIEAHPLTDFQKTIKWDINHGNSIHQSELIASRTKLNPVNEQRINVTLELANIAKKDNASYSCVIYIPYNDDKDGIFADSKIVAANSSVIVLDVPQVSLDYVEAVGATQIFLNWTVNDGNSPIETYFLQYSMKGESTFQYHPDSINGSQTSYVLEKCLPNTSYRLRISAKNAIGQGPVFEYQKSVITLEKDPIFVPEIAIKSSTNNTINIGWAPPSQYLLKYVHGYELTVAQKGNGEKLAEKAYHPQNSRDLPYMFDNLKPGTEYIFHVRACNELTKRCGNWSKPVTMLIHCEIEKNID